MLAEMRANSHCGVSFIVLKGWKSTTQMAFGYLLVILAMRHLVLSVANGLRGWQIHLLSAFQASRKVWGWFQVTQPFWKSQKRTIGNRDFKVHELSKEQDA